MKKTYTAIISALCAAALLCSCSLAPAPEPQQEVAPTEAPVSETALTETPEPSPVSSAKAEETQAQESVPSISVEAEEYILTAVNEIIKAADSGGVSAYITQKLSDAGIEATEDDAGNIVAVRGEAPAITLHSSMDITPGDAPVQSADAITSVKPGNLENACGMACALWLMQSADAAVPLRALFTKTNDAGEKTAALVSADALGSKYVIDTDYYSSYAACVSGSGKTTATLSKAAEKQPASGDNGYKLSVSGLLGGYSYNCVNSGRANAVKLCAQLLRYISASGISFELSEINGGASADTLPSECTAVIVTDADKETLDAAFAEAKEFAFSPYAQTETNAAVTLEATEQFESVFSKDAANDLISALCLAQSGVYTMSQNSISTVESSLNLGAVSCGENAVSLSFCAESEKDALCAQLLSTLRIIGESFGFEIETAEAYKGWRAKEDSTLAALASDTYTALTGDTLWLTSSREYCDCDSFYAINPALDMISLGCEIKDHGSESEKLDIPSLPLSARLMADTINALK